MKFFLIILFIFNSTFNNAEKIDYCDKKLLNCQEKNPPHINCNNNKKFGSDCPKNVQVIRFTAQEKKLIVTLHNKLRNQIAAGNVTGYKPAARMATMRWCRKLAEFAELNAKTCLFEHDGCRNTKFFRYAGQNLARWEGKPGPTSRKEMFQSVILDDIQAWFNEHSDADMSYIDKFISHKEGKKIGHFTVMVADKNKRVGCGAVQFKSEDGSTVIDFACNYATTNVRDVRMYESSDKPGSGCKAGLDCTYESLCSIKEKYDLNKFDKI